MTEAEPTVAENAPDIAISVRNLGKRFQLARDKRTSLKERLVHGRSSKFDEFWALRDVSFDVVRGTTFGLIGHNGSGKSTLLKILAGVYRQTEGSVIADGRVSALLELGAGFHGDLTGRENVYLNASILGLSRKQIDEKIDEIIEFSGIGDFIDVPVKVYSSGMYVRLGFSIAVTVNPEILIVDEIIAVGDEEFQRKCFDHLYKLRKQGTTIVLVTHSLSLAAELCDQAVWLDHGVVKGIGDVREVVDSYLGDVNANEIARKPLDPEPLEVTGAPQTPRRGSGEIRVEDVKFFGSLASESDLIYAGAPCTVRVEYTAKSRSLVEFGLAFIHESGVTVAGPNTSAGKFGLLEVEPGSGYVDYHLDSLPLHPGQYTLSVAVIAHGHVYDYLDRAFDMLVRAESTVLEPGMVTFAGTWTHNDVVIKTALIGETGANANAQ